MPKNYRILLLFMAAIVFSACQKEQTIAPTVEPVDPVNDLIAVNDPIGKLFYILPEHQESVLKQLGATAADEGSYRMMATNLLGNKIPYVFQVRQATLPQLLFQQRLHTEVTDEQLRRWAESVADAGDTLVLRGQLIGRIDSQGVCYRVYKNAECRSVYPGYVSNCESEFRLEVTPDSLFRLHYTGNYVKTTFYPVSLCVKGKGYCVEVMRVHSERRVYDNDSCTGAPLRTRVSSYRYNCAN